MRMNESTHLYLMQSHRHCVKKLPSYLQRVLINKACSWCEAPISRSYRKNNHLHRTGSADGIESTLSNESTSMSTLSNVELNAWSLAGISPTLLRRSCETDANGLHNLLQLLLSPALLKQLRPLVQIPLPAVETRPRDHAVVVTVPVEVNATMMFLVVISPYVALLHQFDGSGELHASLRGVVEAREPARELVHVAAHGIAESEVDLDGAAPGLLCAVEALLLAIVELVEESDDVGEVEILYVGADAFGAECEYREEFFADLMVYAGGWRCADKVAFFGLCG